MRFESLGALRERQFRLLFTGQLISLMGDAFTPVALAWAVLDLTGSPTDLGFVIGAKTLPLVVFLLVGGVFADRLPRRAVMLSADVVRMGCQGAVAALLLTHNARIWQLIVLQALSGTATAFFNPASTGLTPMTVSVARLQQANALRGISMAVAGVFGFAISGVLVATIGPGWSLAVDAASFGWSAVFLAQLRLPAHTRLPPQSFLSDLHDGWREFTAQTWIWLIVVCASIGNMMSAAFVVLGAVVARDSLGGAGAWAAIVASSSAGALAGGMIALHVKPRRPLLTASLFLLPGSFTYATLALRAPVYVVCATALLTGIANMTFNTLWETTLQQHVSPAALSRVSAYDWFGSLAMQPLGFAIVGPIAVGLGTNTTLWAAGAVSVATALAMLASASVRTLRAQRPAEESSMSSALA